MKRPRSDSIRTTISVPKFNVHGLNTNTTHWIYLEMRRRPQLLDCQRLAWGKAWYQWSILIMPKAGTVRICARFQLCFDEHPNCKKNSGGVWRYCADLDVNLDAFTPAGSSEEVSKEIHPGVHLAILIGEIPYGSRLNNYLSLREHFSKFEEIQPDSRYPFQTGVTWIKNALFQLGNCGCLYLNCNPVQIDHLLDYAVGEAEGDFAGTYVCTTLHPGIHWHDLRLQRNAIPDAEPAGVMTLQDVENLLPYHRRWSWPTGMGLEGSDGVFEEGSCTEDDDFASLMLLELDLVDCNTTRVWWRSFAGYRQYLEIGF